MDEQTAMVLVFGGITVALSALAAWIDLRSPPVKEPEKCQCGSSADI
jgi:hypothetical protein